MELAADTISFVLFIIIPALIYRRFYYSGSFSKQYYTFNLFELITAAIPAGIVIELVSIGVHNLYCENAPISIAMVLDAVSSGYQAGIGSLEHEHAQIFYYLLIVWIFCMPLGIMARKLVRFTRLDRQTKMLRFTNYWHYLLMGEISQFKEVGNDLQIKKSSKNQLIKISVLVKTNEGVSTLYKGMFVDYLLDKRSGKLDRIVLSHVVRRDLSKDGKDLDQDTIESFEFPYYLLHTNKKDYILEGDYLTLKSSEINALEVTHYPIEIYRDIKFLGKELSISGNTLGVILQLIVFCISVRLLVFALTNILSSTELYSMSVFYSLLAIYGATWLLSKIRGN